MNQIASIVPIFFITISCFSTIYSFHAYCFPWAKNNCLIAAFGAAAVLAFIPEQSNPNTFKTMIGGSLIGASIGVIGAQLPVENTIGIIFTISICVSLMAHYNVKYPPGGAIALLPISSTTQIQPIECWFIIVPVLTGISIIWLFSILQTNIINQSWYLKKQ